jgi:hypothetical protein
MESVGLVKDCPGGEMSYEPFDLANYEILRTVDYVPGQVIPCGRGEFLIKQQTGFDWLRWSGIPRNSDSGYYRTLDETLIYEKYEIVGVLEKDNELLLRRPRYTNFICRRKK